MTGDGASSSIPRKVTDLADDRGMTPLELCQAADRFKIPIVFRLEAIPVYWCNDTVGLEGVLDPADWDAVPEFSGWVMPFAPDPDANEKPQLHAFLAPVIQAASNGQGIVHWVAIAGTRRRGEVLGRRPTRPWHGANGIWTRRVTIALDDLHVAATDAERLLKLLERADPGGTKATVNGLRHAVSEMAAQLQGLAAEAVEIRAGPQSISEAVRELQAVATSANQALAGATRAPEPSPKRGKGADKDVAKAMEVLPLTVQAAWQNAADIRAAVPEKLHGPSFPSLRAQPDSAALQSVWALVTELRECASNAVDLDAARTLALGRGAHLPALIDYAKWQQRAGGPGDAAAKMAAAVMVARGHDKGNSFETLRKAIHAGLRGK